MSIVLSLTLQTWYIYLRNLRVGDAAGPILAVYLYQYRLYGRIRRGL